jgi:hypothetical protein
MNKKDLKKLIKESIQEIAFTHQNLFNITVNGHLSKLFKELQGEEYTLAFGESGEGWYLVTAEDEAILKHEFPDGNYSHKKVSNSENPNKPYEYFSLEDIMSLKDYGFHIILMNE